MTFCRFLIQSFPRRLGNLQTSFKLNPVSCLPTEKTVNVCRLLSPTICIGISFIFVSLISRCRKLINFPKCSGNSVRFSHCVKFKVCRL
ncbi:hypothetical protein MtrunA17_Chr3g0091071 [Medicago truncatula]|uniref:Uncharacterized protein n=1 Tax=Medicago truncatula TaxID=3880 RepID=A0A396IMD0_MEDTR|nr:hypothetical protein MtrunA17_Chr3g0091071 [Medicago truncatula]